MKFWKYSGMIYAAAIILLILAFWVEDSYSRGGKGCDDFCGSSFILGIFTISFPLLILIIFICKLIYNKFQKKS